MIVLYFLLALRVFSAECAFAAGSSSRHCYRILNFGQRNILSGIAQGLRRLFDAAGIWRAVHGVLCWCRNRFWNNAADKKVLVGSVVFSSNFLLYLEHAIQ